MAKAIEISLVANTRGFIAGTQDAARALDDVSDSLDDVARDAQRSGQRIGDALADEVQDGVRDADRSLERLEGSFRELATSARRESADAGQALGEVGGRTKETLAEAKSEVLQNAGETFSSFRGDLSDLPQIAQDSFGGIAGAIAPLLGPGGAIVALAGAAGLGLIAGALEQNTENTEAFKQKVSDLASEFIQTGHAGQASLGFVADQLTQLATSTDGNGKSLTTLYDNYRKAQQAGVSSFRDVALAIVGSGQDYDALLEKQEAHLRALQDADAAATHYNGSYQSVDATTRSAVVNQQALVDQLKQAKDAADQASKAQQLYAQVGVADLQAKADAIQHISDSLSDGAGDWQNYYDQATGAFDTEAYVKNYQLIVDKIQGVASFLESSDIPERAKAYIQSLPADQAAAYVGAWKAAQPGQQAQLEAIWDAQGRASGARYVGALKGAIPSDLPGPTISALVRSPDWAAMVRAGQNYVDRNPIQIRGTISGKLVEGYR